MDEKSKHEIEEINRRFRIMEKVGNRKPTQNEIRIEELEKVNEQLQSENARLISSLEDVINQACYYEGALDSMAITVYADAIRLLAEYDRVEIKQDILRRVIATWKGSE